MIQSVPAGHLCEGVQADLQVTNPEAGITYSWNTGETGPGIQAEEAGVYYVTASNANGCSFCFR